MSLIHNLVTFSVVLVVLVFIYYLYNSHLTNELTKYNYDISSNPKLLDYLRTDGLLCPNDYNYSKSDDNYDYCIRNNEQCTPENYDSSDNYNCMKYKAFERNNGKIKYPRNSDDVTPPIVDRCKNLFTSNRQITQSDDESVRKNKIKWDALDPFYYSQKCQNVIKPLNQLP